VHTCGTPGALCAPALTTNNEVNKARWTTQKSRNTFRSALLRSKQSRLKWQHLDAGIKAREWCRNVVLEKLGSAAALTPNERLLFHTLIRVQYLVTQGFQLLADQNLTSDGWKKLRANAKYRVSELVTSVLETYTEKRRDRTSELVSNRKE
jgi:hypothetical protein